VRLIFLKIQKRDFLVLQVHLVLPDEMAKTVNKEIVVTLVDLARMVNLV